MARQRQWLLPEYSHDLMRPFPSSLWVRHITLKTFENDEADSYYHTVAISTVVGWTAVSSDFKINEIRRWVKLFAWSKIRGETKMHSHQTQCGDESVLLFCTCFLLTNFKFFAAFLWLLWAFFCNVLDIIHIPSMSATLGRATSSQLWKLLRHDNLSPLFELELRSSSIHLRTAVVCVLSLVWMKQSSSEVSLMSSQQGRITQKGNLAQYFVML